MSHTLIHIVPSKVLSWLCIHAVATKEHRAVIAVRVRKVDGGIHNNTSVLADDGEGVWACQVDCRTGLKQNVSHERQLCNRVVPCPVRIPVRIVSERKVVVGPLGICSHNGWSVDCESFSSGHHQSSIYERNRQYVSLSQHMYWKPWFCGILTRITDKGIAIELWVTTCASLEKGYKSASFVHGIATELSKIEELPRKATLVAICSRFQACQNPSKLPHVDFSYLEKTPCKCPSHDQLQLNFSHLWDAPFFTLNSSNRTSSTAFRWQPISRMFD